jgi:hypothetical protein
MSLNCRKKLAESEIILKDLQLNKYARRETEELNCAVL